MKRTLFFLLLSTGILISANGTDLAQIMGADGAGFTLIREGSSYPFKLKSDDVKGMTLYRGDTLMTEADTFLEIHLLKGSSMLKLAGGSTLVIEQLDNEGGGVFRLVSGRVRARVSALSPRAEFYLLTPVLAAGLKGKNADFGMDYLPEVRIMRVYSFEGEIPVALFSEGTETSGKKMDKPEAAFLLTSGDLLTFTFRDSSQFPEKVPVTKEIVTFWKGYPFGKEGRFVDKESQVMEGEAPDFSWTLSPQDAGYRGRLKQAGAYTFGLGAGVVFLALLTTLFLPSDERLPGYIFAGFGGGISVMGAGIMGVSALLPEGEGALLGQ